MRLFTTLAFLTILYTAFGQGNCVLIQSVTVTVPDESQFIGYVNTLESVDRVPLGDDEWQYIAITKDSQNNGKIYRNGVLVVEGNWLNLTYSWNRIDLGAVFFTSYSAWYLGDIDEVRISNIVRNGTSILSHYNSNAPFVNDANTTGLWSFDQLVGTTIQASAGNNGSITNATWNPPGRFGQCLSFNGVNSRAVINQTVPTANMTIEF